MDVAKIKVGIVNSQKVKFSFYHKYKIIFDNDIFEDVYEASIQNNKIRIKKNNLEINCFESGIIFSPQNNQTAYFKIYDVEIGIQFHWQRKEDQIFKGSLQLIIENNTLHAINILPVENYLESVISSEMRATSSIELLKAHAVISRSWLLAQIEKNKKVISSELKYESFFENEFERIKWYDREEHLLFDVCADDHCQRYQGITKSTTKAVEQAVKETYGEILSYNNTICDARFAKCCGGVSEIFETTWEPLNHPYLQKIIDYSSEPEGFNLELSIEENAKKWILGKPEAFCNTDDKKILSQILNDYDCETNDFFRWKVSYTQNELSELVYLKTGIDFGIIYELIPLERGVSGRIKRLEIVGSKKTFIIGKELEIRKALSKTHLYSSAFVVEKSISGCDSQFILKGAGWGHGVGLCQIGAAMMATKGYSYKQILRHYYRGAKLEKKY